MRRRLCVETLTIDGAPDGAATVAAVRAALADRVRSAGPTEPSARRDGAIRLTLPPRSTSTAIGAAVAAAVGGALNRGGRRR